MRNSIIILLNFVICLSIQTVLSAQTSAKTEMPMKFRGSMPAVEVMVNGKGPFLFAIDTGGQGQARADSSLVEKLGLKTVGQVQAGDGSGQNDLTLDVVSIDSIKLGEIEFKNIRALTRDYNRSPALPKIDGILGFDLFKDHLLTLDYPNKIVRLEKGALPQANSRDILEYADTDGIAMIELVIGDESVKAHIDSGNTVGGFILPEETVKKLPLTGEPKVVGQARTISNTIEIKQVRLNGSIRIGGIEFKDPLVTFPALRQANVGSQLLKDFAITFDQKNKRLRLVRGEEKQVVPRNTEPLLKEFTGKYGVRRISEENGSLFIQREGGPLLKLIKTGKDEYSLENIPAAKINFVRDQKGSITAIRVLNPKGEWETSARDN
ncbi:MAG: retropepsin-like aspartic protease [Pyrinomonadaceae bacterium]